MAKDNFCVTLELRREVTCLMLYSKSVTRARNEMDMNVIGNKFLSTSYKTHVVVILLM